MSIYASTDPQVVTEQERCVLAAEFGEWVAPIKDKTRRRRLLDQMTRESEDLGLSGEDLHARQAHPYYEYRTTEGARKGFYDENVPPGGDESWERNVHRGREGWERFDYHEEAYWMRRVEGGR